MPQMMDAVSDHSKLQAEEARKRIAAENGKKTKKAKKNPGPGNGNGDGLLDLSTLDVEPVSDEEAAREAEEARKRKAFAEQAAAKLTAAEKEIGRLEEIAKNGILSSEQVARLKHLREEVKKVREFGDTELRNHREFAEFLEFVRGLECNTLNGRKIVERVIADDRYRLATSFEVEETKRLARERKPWTKGYFHFEGKGYMPAFKEEEKTGGQKALEAEITRFFRHLNKTLMEDGLKGVPRILAEGERDLSGLESGKLGTYAIFYPAHTGENGEEKKDGSILVSIRTKKVGKDDKETIILSFDNCAGSMTWMQGKGLKGRWFPFSWFHSGKPSESAPEEAKETARQIAKVVWKGFYLWKAAQEAPTQK